MISSETHVVVAVQGVFLPFAQPPPNTASTEIAYKTDTVYSNRASLVPAMKEVKRV